MVGRVSAPIAMIIIRIMITMIKLLRDGWSHDEKTLRKSQGRSTPRRAAFGSYSQSPLTSQEHLCNVWLNILILTFQSIRSCTRASIFQCLDLHSEDHRWVKLHPDQVHLNMYLSQDGRRKMPPEVLLWAVPQLNTAQSDLEIETHLAANLLSSAPLISRRVPDFDSRKLCC